MRDPQPACDFRKIQKACVVSKIFVGIHEQSAKTFGIAGTTCLLSLKCSPRYQLETALLRSQRQVLSLYRTVLRTARTKGPETGPIIKFARAEFEKYELWHQFLLCYTSQDVHALQVPSGRSKELPAYRASHAQGQKAAVDGRAEAGHGCKDVMTPKPSCVEVLADSIKREAQSTRFYWSANDKWQCQLAALPL